jgi:hypothetical protein
MADKKVTTVNGIKITEYEDGTTFITVDENTCAFVDSADAVALALALVPLYVVKSEAGCYATYMTCDPSPNVDSARHCEFIWTEDRSKAAHFVSKGAARAVAKNCYPTAGARVMRVKR